jgi:uncharacterized coiled-coil protein SlyX
MGGLLDKQKQQFEAFLQKTEQGKKREVREKQEQVDALHEKLHDVEEGLQASKDALISAQDMRCSHISTFLPGCL